MKHYSYLAGAFLALAACGGGEPEAARFSVSDVTVNSDLSAVGSRDAARYWGNLDADLESAIAREFVGESSAQGVALVIDVDELSVADFFQSAAGADSARLTGEVTVLNSPSGEPIASYIVSASANQAMTLLAADGRPVTNVRATNAEFYAAVIEAFARGVAGAVRGGGTTGG